MLAAYNIYTDEDLVVLMSHDDEAAFTEIYDRYWKKISVQAAAKLGDWSQAEDIVQDLLGNLWKRRAEIRLTGKLEHYLAVALKYQIINALATRRRERLYKMEGKVAGTERTTEQWLDFEELRHQLGKLVGKLPERCRMAYQLGRDHGLSQKEIALQMKISEKAVEQNTTRALRSLRLGLR